MAQSRMENVVLDMTTLSKQEQQNYAKKFCEGSKQLEELLKYLWSNGINTFASCAGHNEEKLANGMVSQNNPYIHFDTSSFTQEELQNLLRKLIGLNELRDRKYLTFDVKAQSFTEDERRKGFVGENEKERHSITIRFLDKKRENYKELLKVVESVKNKKNSLLVKLKSRFDKTNKLHIGWNNFLQVATELNELSLNDNQQYELLQVSYTQNGIRQNVRGKRPNSTTSHIYQGQDEQEVLEVSKGYYTKTKDNKYLTLFGGSVIELEADEIQGLKPFTADQKDIGGIFDIKNMRKVLDEVNQQHNVNQTL